MATVIGAFFAVVATAWLLAAFLPTTQGHAAGFQPEPVAFQPSQALRLQLTSGYVTR